MTAQRQRTPVSAVVFDLDGTLIDSRADIAAAVNHVLHELGYATLPLEQVMGYVGDGAGHLIMRAAGLPVDAPELKPILEQFLEYYTAHAADNTTWMPGAIEALDALASCPLAICTNKPKVTTLAVLNAFGVVDRFAAIIGGGDLPLLKPDPLPLLTIAEQLHCAVETLVIVGDGPQDVEAGKRAGAFTIGVRGGIASPERLLASDPDLVLHSLWELPAAITRLREA